MGLELYHLKATLAPSQTEETHTFREDELDYHPLDVLGLDASFRPYRIPTIPPASGP